MVRSLAGRHGLSLLTFYRLAVHQPLDRRLGVPVGAAHQPAVLTRGQNEVLGFIQPVWSSFKHTNAPVITAAARSHPKPLSADLTQPSLGARGGKASSPHLWPYKHTTTCVSGALLGYTHLTLLLGQFGQAARMAGSSTEAAPSMQIPPSFWLGKGKKMAR